MTTRSYFLMWGLGAKGNLGIDAFQLCRIPSTHGNGRSHQHFSKEATQKGKIELEWWIMVLSRAREVQFWG